MALTPPQPFPDLQRAIAALIQAGTPGLPADRTGSVRPSADDLKKSLPFVVTYRIGGGNDGVTDAAQIAVEVYAKDYKTGYPLASSIQALISGGPHVIALTTGSATSSVLVDYVRVLNAPSEAPYGDNTVRLWVATYRVEARRLIPTS